MFGLPLLTDLEEQVRGFVCSESSTCSCAGLMCGFRDESIGLDDI